MSIGAKFNFGEKVLPKIHFNMGACLDIPSCSLILGAKGETITNGGLGTISGIAGAGNNYKTTMELYMLLSALAKVLESKVQTQLMIYDTEINTSIERIEELASAFKSIGQNAVTREDNVIIVVDKTTISGDEFGEQLFKYMEEKMKDPKLKVEFQCFLDPYTHKPRILPIPTFNLFDSWTGMETATVTSMLSGNLDDKDTNTFAMKQGMFKTKLLSQLPARGAQSNSYIGMTVHVGGKVDIQAKPWEVASKPLQYLNGGDSLKGTGSNFTFYTNIAYQATDASAFYNQNTKAPEYPRDPNDTLKSDLNKVKLTILRNKNGPSGVTIEILVSQDEGVLPTLTEFHNIKSQRTSGQVGYGISGNDRSYYLDLYPDVSLSRTTVRSKIDTDAKLRRAINITSEMLQLSVYHGQIMSSDIWCTPAELYQDLKDMGYDWDKLLDTRGYWLINQYDKDNVPYIHTVDLLKMRKGLYHPWWYDKKDLKKK